MRLSLMKGAHADLSSTAWQEIGVKPYFGLSGLGCLPNPFVIKACGIPLKPKNGLTPISCYAALERSACAPFIKERRMVCINATSLHRKSGQMGHPT